MKKIMIVHATAGIGHVKAALALESALKSRRGVSYSVVDVLDYTNPLMKWSYRSFYITLVKYVPFLWAAIYYLLDVPLIFRLIKDLRSTSNRFQSKKFMRYLTEVKPDTIVATHFFPVNVISYLKKLGIINARLVCVITDFKLHTYWFSDNVDIFVVAGDALKKQLIKHGIPADDIKVLGIPIDLKFHQNMDRAELSSKFNIKNNLFTVLIGSGGFGVGPVRDLVVELSKTDIEIQLIVICGKNAGLYADLGNLKASSRIPINVYGFVDNMHEFMSVSDLLVSKAGGMTTSEAIARELPMIISSPIPGQEMRNCQFLVESGSAIREDAPSRIKEKIIELSKDKKKLDSMKANIRAIKKSNPAEELADLVERL